MKPLFIPLKSEYLDAFASRRKSAEYRSYGPRWNERTCIVGRPVTLSKGYGKHHRLSGVITAFTFGGYVPDEYVQCYGPERLPVAEIRIRVDGAR